MPLKCVNRVGVLINNTLAIQFFINLNSIYIKIGESLTKTLKLSTVSRPLSSLKYFPWNSFASKDSFCCAKVKIKF